MESLRRALLRVSCLIAFLSESSKYVAGGQTQTPTALFIFGDSLVDSGNNNYIATFAKANYAWNGVDFPLGPTGRFCNGRHVPDIVGQSLGLPFIPVYLDPNTKGTAIFRGVNYASGGAGILDDTGKSFIEVIPMDKQLQYFENTKIEMVKLVGQTATDMLLADSLFAVTVGSNDYLSSYFTLNSPLSSDFTPREFEDILIQKHTMQLKALYGHGARKIVVAALGPLGCIPSLLDLTQSENGTCDPRNSIVTHFNSAMRTLIGELNTQLGNSHFVYANSYDIVIDILRNASRYGFSDTTKACCGTGGEYNGIIPCLPGVPICSNRSSNVFWDPYHPTEAVNKIIASRILDGTSSDAYPVNVRTLVSYRFYS